MRTMIARLKHEESDLLGDSQNVEVRRPEERRAMYQRIDEQFKSTASPVMQLLGDQFAKLVQISVRSLKALPLAISTFCPPFRPSRLVSHPTKRCSQATLSS